MRPTTFTQRTRSRLAGLAAEPGDRADPVSVDEPGSDTGPATSDEPAPSDEPDEPDSSETPVARAGGVPRGPSSPAWLDDPRPSLFGSSSAAADDRASRTAGLNTAGLDTAASDTPASDEADARAGQADGRTRISAWVPERWRGARFAISGRGLAVLALLGLVVAAIAGLGVARDQPAAGPVPVLPEIPAPVAAGLSMDVAESGVPAPGPGGQESGGGAGGVSGAAAAPEEIVVSVQGLVGAGGLVRLEPGARVADAIDAAGGALDGADLLSLNLAQRLGDGDQVLVGVAPTDGGPPRLGSATIVEGGAASGPTASSAGAGLVNLNTATAADLEALPGVGPVTAASIVEWRTGNGRFTSVDQLSEVRGIGPARLASLRELVTV